ncbi:MAG: MFS transporter [Candidatus Eremiobacteraeota bacterium]|nr:MFS transporter [Candidatus Eremiobacteraeota bacterium]
MGSLGEAPLPDALTTSPPHPGNARQALRFVVLVGIVNCFSDFTYEGGRGVAGAFLGHLGASGAAVGIVAGGGELAGFAIRSVAGMVADRTGLYWLDIWLGYAINVLCVPALAFAGSWPAAAGLLVGERVGRGIRKPVTAAILSEAGRSLGSGRVFGLNEALDQTGATAGPLLVAFAILRGGYHTGFGILIVPALLTLAFLAVAHRAGRSFVPRDESANAPVVRDWPAFRRYAIGGALVAAGYVDFALIAFRFQRDGIVSVAAISLWFAAAMGVAAISSAILGRLYDRVGKPIVGVAIAVTALATPLAFLGVGAAAQAGAALWGVGTAVQDALLLALLAGVVARRRATTFGLYDLVIGIAWFAGSAICGVLLDRSALSLVLFSTLLQLLAIPFFVIPARASRRSY